MDSRKEVIESGLQEAKAAGRYLVILGNPGDGSETLARDVLGKIVLLVMVADDSGQELEREFILTRAGRAEPLVVSWNQHTSKEMKQLVVVYMEQAASMGWNGVIVVKDDIDVSYFHNAEVLSLR